MCPDSHWGVSGLHGICKSLTHHSWLALVFGGETSLAVVCRHPPRHKAFKLATEVAGVSLWEELSVWIEVDWPAFSYCMCVLPFPNVWVGCSWQCVTWQELCETLSQKSPVDARAASFSSPVHYTFSSIPLLIICTSFLNHFVLPGKLYSVTRQSWGWEGWLLFPWNLHNLVLFKY